MMPVRPAALAVEAFGLDSQLNRHIGDPAALLPCSEMRGDVLLDDPLAFEVGGGDGAELVLRAAAAGDGAHPLDAGEALLEDVVGARFEIALLPAPQPVAG